MPRNVAAKTFQYGSSPDQSADLYYAESPSAAVVCLLHGGFWRMPYGRDQLDAMASDLVTRGYTVWNIGYRRVGAIGGGFPGTFEDTMAAIHYLTELKAKGYSIDLNRVVIAGHSAGGHLALWFAAQQKYAKTSVAIHPLAVAGLAPVADLVRTWELGSGKGAVAQLLGGDPAQYPDRYALLSPIALLPFDCEQLIMHGAQDTALPIDLSRHYAEHAKAVGAQLTYIDVPNAGHMDFIDPNSEAFTLFCQWLAKIAQR